MILKRRPEIDRFLQAPEADFHAALIFGPEIAIVRERSRLLAGMVTARPDDPFDVALLSEADLEEVGKLESELMAISMTGGRRLVRLRMADGRAEPAAASALAEHLAGDFNPEAFFLIEAGNLKAGSPLRRAAEKADGCAAIACYEDEPGDIARLAREALATDGVGLRADALDLFVSRLPPDRGVVRQEIERLVLFLGPGSGRLAESDDLEGFFGVEPEASLAKASIAAFGGRAGEARANFRRAAQEGEAGPTAVRAMSAHLARLRRVLTLHQKGTSLALAAKASGVFWKEEREFLRQARCWTFADLDRVQNAVFQADRGCKQTGAPDDLLVERLALTVSGQARRLGL